MYHPFQKNSSYLRNAIFKEYKGKCVYCGVKLQPRNMHIDHILPTEPQTIDDDVADYIQELEADGFVQDSIENYLPSCPACNREKSNQVYKTTNLIRLHEQARKHVTQILERIEKEKENEEYYYEPVDDNIWKQLDFKYQRGISHAIMGYRLTAADVTSCPEFPQVSLTEKQLSIVDYAMIMGEPGCGKSISLFQIGYHYYLKGWHVYHLNGNNELTAIKLSDNTENSLYLIDDTQIYPGYLINDVCGQSRPNRKVLLAKTVTDQVRSEDILLTNDVAVNILYEYFIGIKDEILPIVSKCDKNVGANMNDISIELRLQSAKKAKTPWQFAYILRGGWNTIKNAYSSISKRHDLDLLLATIATFQILNLDKSVDLSYINELYKTVNLNYNWTEKEITLLVKKQLVLSDDDIRIVHIESANVVVSLFFDCVQTEAQKALIQVIENEYRNKRVSPLGIVWLCNGCRYVFRYYSCAEQVFITDNIKKSTDDQIKDLYTSEETRNMLFLLERIIVADRNGQDGIQIYKNNESKFVKLINNADSVSALGFSYLLNSLYNHDKTIHFSLSQNTDWEALMLKMVSEDNCDYYSWGRLFDRGLNLLGKKERAVYSEGMYSVMEQTVGKANINNIEQITHFLCYVCFLNPEKIHDLMLQRKRLTTRCLP